MVEDSEDLKTSLISQDTVPSFWKKIRIQYSSTAFN